MSITAPPFVHRYEQLPSLLHHAASPTPVAAPSLLHLNASLARLLGFDPQALTSEDGVALLSGNAVPDTSTPIAMAYAGHQFGHPVPQLGDGRALLLGELVGTDGVVYEVQLKGAGRTVFSRGGDGRNHIGPVLREYVVSEAMHALGVPTTRALAAVATGERVQRETSLPGAIVTRVATSHVRVGTFEFPANRGNVDALRALVDHVITHHIPDAVDHPNRALALLEHVVRVQAELVAQWMALGFIHGVMNTDNCSVVGLTIDYGPCAFMDTFDPAKVFSSIDRQGRYAYQNQPVIAQFNAMTLARCLLPLLAPTTEAAIALAQPVIDRFEDHYRSAHRRRMAHKLGIVEPTPDDDALVDAVLDLMHAQDADFTRFFRGLTVSDTGAAAELRDPDALTPWLAQWRMRVGDTDAARGHMATANPSVIPRNHQVQAVIDAASTGDLAPLNALVDATRDPFADRPLDHPLTLAPEPAEVVHRTFCGT